MTRHFFYPLVVNETNSVFNQNTPVKAVACAWQCPIDFKPYQAVSIDGFTQKNIGTMKLYRMLVIRDGGRTEKPKNDEQLSQ